LDGGSAHRNAATYTENIHAKTNIHVSSGILNHDPSMSG
jgi:hypothetical protein